MFLRSYTSESSPNTRSSLPSSAVKDHSKKSVVNVASLRRHVLESYEFHEITLREAITALLLNEDGEVSNSFESDLGETLRQKKQRILATKLEEYRQDIIGKLNEMQATPISPPPLHNSKLMQFLGTSVFEQNTEESFSRQIESKKSKYGTDTQSLREMHAKLAVVANNGRGPKYRKRKIHFPGQEQTLYQRLNLFEKNDTVDPYAIASILDYPDSQRNTSFLPDQDMFFSMTKKDRNVLDLEVPPTFLTDPAKEAILQIVVNDFDYGPKDDDLIGWALIDLKKYFLTDAATGERPLVVTLPNVEGVLKLELMTPDGYSAGDLYVELNLLLPTEGTPPQLTQRLEQDSYGTCPRGCHARSAIVRLTILEGREMCNPDAITTLAESIPWGFALRISGAATLILFFGSMLVFFLLEEESITNTFYVIVCTFTTVGYGDITASSTEGQILTSFIAFMGLALLSVDLVLVYGFIVAQRQISAKHHLHPDANDAAKGKSGIENSDLPSSTPDQETGALKHEEHGHHKHTIVHNKDDEDEDYFFGTNLVSAHSSIQVPWAMAFPWPDWLQQHHKRFILTGFKFLFGLLVGTVGFRIIERNGDQMQASDAPWATAFYWASITSATVGYGDVYPVTAAGKWFAIIYILGSTAVVAEALGAPTDILLQRLQSEGMKKVLSTRIDRVMFQRMDEDEGGSISRDEYLRAMIINLGLVDRHVVDRLFHQFDELDTQENGEVTLSDLSAGYERERAERIRTPAANDISLAARI